MGEGYNAKILKSSYSKQGYVEQVIPSKKKIAKICLSKIRNKVLKQKEIEISTTFDSWLLLSQACFTI